MGMEMVGMTGRETPRLSFIQLIEITVAGRFL